MSLTTESIHAGTDSPSISVDPAMQRSAWLNAGLRRTQGKRSLPRDSRMILVCQAKVPFPGEARTRLKECLR